MRSTSRTCAYGVIGLSAALVAALPSYGQITTLEDGNSLVRFNTAEPGDRIGMDRWIVDGTNHLFNQWFWFRQGTTGPEQRINSLPEIFRLESNTNADPRPDTLSITYGSPTGLAIETRFSVQGGLAGSNTSDVGEQIRIWNNGTTPLTMSFFQYCDFDLNNDIVDDFVNISPLNTASQGDSNGAIVTETVVTPMPSNREAGIYSGTINALDDADTDNLNGVTSLFGPPRADFTWAFQWDFTVPAGGSFLISKDKLLVPAPGAFALLGVAGVFGARRRRR